MILYSNHCPLCRQVKEVLKRSGVKYEENNDVEDILRVAEKHGITSMPILLLEGVYYSGYRALNKVKEI